jgi:hypothetical protein
MHILCYEKWRHFPNRALLEIRARADSHIPMLAINTRVPEAIATAQQAWLHSRAFFVTAILAFRSLAPDPLPQFEAIYEVLQAFHE